jgi:hypothetical protein
VVEPDAQLTQRAGFFIPTSGFPGSFRAQGSAQLAFYEQVMWDKYQLATMAGGDFKTNTLIGAKEVSTNDTHWRF